MNVDGIKLLYEYNIWANQRVLRACAKVSPEQYAAPTSFGIGYGSLRATVIHILDAECVWRLLCQEVSITNWQELTEAEIPTLNALEERWQAEQQEMWAYIGTLTDEKLNGILRYTIDTGIVRERVLWHCLYHAVNHGTQHRSEAAALLTSYDQSPGDFDFTLFLNEHFNLPS